MTTTKDDQARSDWEGMNQAQFAPRKLTLWQRLRVWWMRITSGTK